MSKIVKAIKNPCKIVAYLGSKGYFKWIPDKLYLSIYFRAVFERNINWKNPKCFNEKLQWLKIYDRQNIYTSLVDKQEVKKYIADVIGKEYVIPTLGVWDNVENISFEKLPERFVLKCTHDSGGIVICKDKSILDIDLAKKTLKKSLHRKFFYNSREWPYKNVKRRIIAEKYLESYDEDELKDYKLLCFNGQVKCLFVCSERHSKSGLKVTFFDMNWNRMPFERHYPMSKLEIKKPEKIKEMIELAEKLAKDIPFVRVDFYEVSDKIYFGEMTFYPGGGWEKFYPEEWDEVLGSWIKLPMDK